MATLVRLVRASALAASMAAISAYGSLPAAEPRQPQPTSLALPKTPLDLGSDVADFYRDRGFAPLWVAGSALRPATARLLSLLPPDPQLENAVRAAASGEAYALARADLLLTKAYADHFITVGRPPETNNMHYVDAELRPANVTLRASLDHLASTRNIVAHLLTIESRNPAFDGLRRGLDLYRARWSALPQHVVPGSADRALLERRMGVTGEEALVARLREFQRIHALEVTGLADPATVAALNRGAAFYERLIERNIERARAIPARPNGRYILVDTASAQLWMIDDGRIVDRMRVIVGKAGMQTPAMAGLMRHVVLNPYWNLPPDLIRQRARNAVRRSAAIANERLQVLSDWSDQARPLDPRQVDWASVATGRRYVNLRQRPGPDNMMGAIKFMFPNELGIYLHDTPFREHFARSDRRISSGCVRVEDAARLTRWVFGGVSPRPSGTPEQEVDLPEPIPVYITHLTALPTRDGIVFQRDHYGRDRVRTGSARNREGRARPARPE